MSEKFPRLQSKPVQAQIGVCSPAYEIVVHSEWCAVNGSNWSVLFGMEGLVPW